MNRADVNNIKIKEYATNLILWTQEHFVMLSSGLLTNHFKITREEIQEHVNSLNKQLINDFKLEMDPISIDYESFTGFIAIVTCFETKNMPLGKIFDILKVICTSFYLEVSYIFEGKYTRFRLEDLKIKHVEFLHTPLPEDITCSLNILTIDFVEGDNIIFQTDSDTSNFPGVIDPFIPYIFTLLFHLIPEIKYYKTKEYPALIDNMIDANVLSIKRFKEDFKDTYDRVLRRCYSFCSRLINPPATKRNNK